MPPFFFSLLCCCCCCDCFTCDDPLLCAAVSMLLGCEASLVPLSRRSDAVRVLECEEEVVCEALSLGFDPSVATLLRTASLGTRTSATALG